jgi:hypothetical protein
MLKAILLSLFLALSLNATQAKEPQAQNQEQMIELDKEETFHFVKALVLIEQYRATIKEKVLDDEGKVDKTKEEAVNEEFQAKAKEIIQNEGLTLQTYAKYLQLLQHSTDFQKIVQNIISSFTRQPQE